MLTNSQVAAKLANGGGTFTALGGNLIVKNDGEIITIDSLACTIQGTWEYRGPRRVLFARRKLFAICEGLWGQYEPFWTMIDGRNGTPL